MTPPPPRPPPTSDYDEGRASLAQFTADMMVEACVRCLRATISDFQSPTRLPEAMSSRYRMCSNLANACQVNNCMTDLTVISIDAVQ